MHLLKLLACSRMLIPTAVVWGLDLPGGSTLAYNLAEQERAVHHIVWWLRVK